MPFKGLCLTEPYFAFGETLKNNWLARGYLRGKKEGQPVTGTPGECWKPGGSLRVEPMLCSGPGFLLCLAWHQPAVRTSAGRGSSLGFWPFALSIPIWSFQQGSSPNCIFTCTSLHWCPLRVDSQEVTGIQYSESKFPLKDSPGHQQTQRGKRSNCKRCCQAQL